MSFIDKCICVYIVFQSRNCRKQTSASQHFSWLEKIRRWRFTHYEGIGISEKEERKMQVFWWVKDFKGLYGEIKRVNEH